MANDNGSGWIRRFAERLGWSSQTPKQLQSEMDRVLTLDEKSISPGLTSGQPGVGRTPAPIIGSIGTGSGSAVTAPVHPAAEPKPGSQPSALQKGTESDSYGVSGTPITSAFLLDLGEYNPQLMGRTAVPVWEKMRRGDDMAWALLSVWRLPVMSAKWDITEADDDKPAAKVSSNGAGKTTKSKKKEVADFVRANLFGGLEYQTSTGAWVSQQWQSVIYNASLMLDFGCSVHEDVWHVDGDKIRLRALPGRLPLTYYRWPVEPDGETLIALEQYGYRGSNYLNVTLPVEKMCRFTYRQEGANFFGISLSRGLYSPWFFKDRFKRIMAVAAEKNSLGIPIWRLYKGFDPNDEKKANSLMAALAAHERTYLVEPPAVDAADTKAGFRYESPRAAADIMRGLLQIITYFDIAMARAAIAMFIQSGQTPFGNKSTTKEHADFFLLAAQSLADQIRFEIQCSTVRRLVWYNFGEDAPVPELVAANVQARQLEDLTALLQQLGTAGMVVSDQGLRDDLRKELALPKETRDGLVAVRGETIDPGAAGGPEVMGKGAMPIGGAPQPPQQKVMREATLYHRLPDDETIKNLKPGDAFKLSRPVLFGEADANWQVFRAVESSGPTLIVKGTLSSNAWLKGSFRVRLKDDDGNLICDHLNEAT